MVMPRKAAVMLLAVLLAIPFVVSSNAVAQSAGDATIDQSGPRAEIAALQSRIKALADRGKHVIGQVASSGISSSDILRARDRLDAAIQVAVGAPAMKDVSDLSAIRDELEAALREFERISGAAAGRREPPEPLRRAVTTFFLGRYHEALDILGATPFSDDEARAYSNLISAASRFALYRLGGQRSGELLDGAKADVRAVVRYRPSLVPTEAHFSPAFVEFFTQNSGK